MSKKVACCKCMPYRSSSMGSQLNYCSAAAEMGAVVIGGSEGDVARSRLITYTWDVLSRLALVGVTRRIYLLKAGLR